MGGRTVCFITLNGEASVCIKELIGEPIDCDKCEVKKKFEGREKKYFIYTRWTEELKKVEKEKIRSLVKRILDLLYEIDKKAVKEWAYDKWPSGIELYD